MFNRYLIPPLLVLILGTTSCISHRMDMAWPETRPLGKEISAYRPPQTPSDSSSASIQAAEPSGTLTLPQALSLALLKNPELAAFSWEVRAGEARTLQASLLPNPEVEGVVENLGNSSLEGTDGVTTTIQLSQLILVGGKRSKRTQVAALERDLAGWDYETKRLDVLTDVSKAFADVLAAQERLALNEELVRLADEVSTTVSERVRAGKVSPIEETRAKVSLATAQIELERTKRELVTARNRLAATWGARSPSFEKVTGHFDAIKPVPSAEQLISLISQNPDIVRWVVEMERRRAAVKLEDARRIPDPTLNGGFRRFNDANESAFLVGLSIPFPLFDRNQGGALEARYNLAKANEERTAAEVRVRTALAETYQSLSTAYVEAKALKTEVLPGAQSAFDASSEGYRLGKFDYLDVLDAQRTFFEARARYIEALAAYHKAVADVERLIGEPLDSVKYPPQ